MKRLLYLLIVAHSVLFSGELALYNGHNKIDIVACYKHTIPELILDSKLKNTADHDDIKKDGSLLLKMREVQSSFNTLIENTTHIRHVIGTGNMANLVPYFFQGLPQRPQYETPITSWQLYCTHIPVLLGALQLYTKFMANAGRTVSAGDMEWQAVNALIGYVCLNSPRYTQFQMSFAKIAFSPYFYQQWKKEQNEHDIIEYNLDFVTNKENTLLSTSFEDLLLKHCFDADTPWYNTMLQSSEPLKTIYGQIITSTVYNKVISYPDWPANLELRVLDTRYKSEKLKQFKLIDFSDEFEESVKIPYKNELPFDFIVDIKIVPKAGDHPAWNHTLNKIDIGTWFKAFSNEYDIANKKIALHFRFSRNNVPANLELMNNLGLIQKLLFNQCAIIDIQVGAW